MDKQKVYLAGGFESNWREKVIKGGGGGFDFINPKRKEFLNRMSGELYTTWDFHYIRKCDIVFAFLEKNNPSGYGLSVEIGYAKSHDTTIILVIEPGHHNEKYFDIIKAASDVVFLDLKEGIDFLNKFLLY